MTKQAVPARPKGFPRAAWRTMSDNEKRKTVGQGAPKIGRSGKKLATVYDAFEGTVAALDKNAHERAMQQRRAAASLQIRGQHAKNVGPHMCPNLGDFYKQLAAPFTYRGMRGLMGVGNVCASSTSFPLMSTHTFTLNVGTNTTSEIGLFGGHGNTLDGVVNGAPMDTLSNHAYPSFIGGTAGINEYMIGPMKGATISRQAVGYITSALTLGAATNTTGLASSLPIENDNALPFTAQEGDGAHSRWRLVGMGVRLYNTTVTASRGGNISYVQLNQSVSVTAQSELAIYGAAFAQSRLEDTDEGLEITWIPATTDLGYWHTEQSTGTATGGNGAARLRIYIDNPTAVSQLYKVQIVCHWEVAGTSLKTMQSPSPSSFAAKGTIENTVNKVRAVAATAHGIAKMGSHVLGQMTGIVSAIAKDPRIPATALKATRTAAAIMDL